MNNIRIITVSGRIACGSTTLAKGLAQKLGWRHIEGGEVFWEAVRKKMGLSSKETHLRPDEEDKAFDEHLKTLLQEEKNLVLETKLSGFNAQGIDGVFKMLLLCEDERGNDLPEVRIQRLIDREGISMEEARAEVLEREANDIAKWQKMYGNNDSTWTYFDKKYYDVVINTATHNQKQALEKALESIGI